MGYYLLNKRKNQWGIISRTRDRTSGVLPSKQEVDWGVYPLKEDSWIFSIPLHFRINFGVQFLDSIESGVHYLERGGRPWQGAIIWHSN